MAGEWIRVEKVTPDKPKMGILARKMGVSLGDAFLEWFKFYCWLDSQTEDGFVPDLVPIEAGHLSRCCPALVPALTSREVGWIIPRDGGFEVKNWSDLNGKCSKTRAMEQRKKKRQRASSRYERDICPDGIGTSSGPEKRREEKSKEGERQMPLPPPQEGKNGSKPKVFIRELAVVREGIVEEMKRLKAKGCSETANGVGWTDERCKVEYAALLQRRKALDEEMRKAAGV